MKQECSQTLNCNYIQHYSRIGKVGRKMLILVLTGMKSDISRHAQVHFVVAHFVLIYSLLHVTHNREFLFEVLENLYIIIYIYTYNNA